MSELSVEFNNEQVPVPEQFTVRIGGDYTPEKAQADFLSALGKVPIVGGDQGNDGGGQQGGGTEGGGANGAGAAGAGSGTDDGGGGGNSGGDGAPVITDEQRQSAFVEYLKSKGFEGGLTEFDAVLEETRTVKQRAKQLEEMASVLDEYDSPFADPIDAQIAHFKKTTGIMDREIASAMIETTKENLADNPVLAMALSEIINNQEMGKEFKLADIMGKIQRQQERAGVDFEQKDTPEYKDLLIEARKAVRTVEKFRETTGADKNIVQKLVADRQAEQKVFGEKLTSVKSEISNLSLKELTHEFDGKTISLEAPKDLLSAIPERVLHQLAQTFDISKQEGRDALKAQVVDFLLVSQVKSGALAKAAYAKGQIDGKAAAEEKSARERFNGGAGDLNRGGKGGKSVEVSDIKAELNEAWKQ